LLRSAFITRFISGLLLVVFACSITPKRLLHDLFAKHIDNRAGKNNKAPCQLTHAGYNCDNDNLVAESSFEISQQAFSFPIFTTFSSYIFKNISYGSVSGNYSSLRGPPVKI
jgi:hypothetical protein